MKKLVKYLTVAFVISVVVILLKNEFSYKLLCKENYGIPALIEQRSVDNLFIGSSMFRMGLDINSIDKNNKENYILSYNGNQPILEYYELESILRQDVDINTLYIDMYIYSMCAEPKVSDEKMLMEIGIRDKWNLWKVLSENNGDVDGKTFWQMFASSNNELLLTWPLSKRIINSRFYKGGNTLKTESSSEEKLKSLKMPELKNILNLIQVEYTRKLISLAKDRGIHIVYVESPKYATVAENKLYLEMMEEYSQILDEEDVEYILCNTTWNMIGKPEGISHYDYDHFDETCFLDTVHLSYDGRVIFSENIGDFLK